MERYWIENGILAPNECGGLVKYADAQATVEALQRERDEAIEAAARPTWVCDGCGRVSQEGWINHTIECLDGTEYEMECPVCGVRVIEVDCALDLARERDDLQTTLDAERDRLRQQIIDERTASQGAVDEVERLRKALEEIAGNLMGSPKRKLMLADDDFWSAPGEHTLRQWLAQAALTPATKGGNGE